MVAVGIETGTPTSNSWFFTDDDATPSARRDYETFRDTEKLFRAPPGHAVSISDAQSKNHQ